MKRSFDDFKEMHCPLCGVLMNEGRWKREGTKGFDCDLCKIKVTIKNKLYKKINNKGKIK